LCHYGFTGLQSGVGSVIASIWCETGRCGINFGAWFIGGLAGCQRYCDAVPFNSLNPYKRHEELSEFLYDLRHPNKAFLNKARPPQMERDPVLFWKGISFILVVVIAILLSR
jgi:hypothetical protein